MPAVHGLDRGLVGSTRRRTCPGRGLQLGFDMQRGLLASPAYRPQFSGHETFPLRQLWLRKAFDEVVRHKEKAAKSLFADAEAIARFGVGKNMVTAIRHWALACEVLEEGSDGTLSVGQVGSLLFGKAGMDPYLEHPASAWLVHWLLAGEGRRSTTWYWVFNHVLGPLFDRSEVSRGLSLYVEDAKLPRASAETIQRDVEVCLRSYAPRSGTSAIEDAIEPVLGELGLIAYIRGAEYAFRVGAKPSLPDGILLFALDRSWDRLAGSAKTLNLDVLAYERGSPGLVFKMDIDSLAERLVQIEQSSAGAFAWSETAGLRQVARKRPAMDSYRFIRQAYAT